MNYWYHRFQRYHCFDYMLSFYRYRRSICRYREIFDISICWYRSSEFRYRRFFDIVLRWYRSSRLRYQRFFDIVLRQYRMLQHIVPDHDTSSIEGHFSTFDHLKMHLRYRNKRISKVRPSISKVGKAPDAPGPSPDSNPGTPGTGGAWWPCASALRQAETVTARICKLGAT